MSQRKKRADQRKYHILYKTVCVVTGKYYKGMHSTDDINDGYLGSGKILHYSIKKHGRENHIKEIIGFCETREILRVREKQEVDEYALKDPLCMNIVIGGNDNGSCGGRKKGSIPWNKGKQGQISPMKGKKHTDEARKKMSDAHMGKGKPKSLAMRQKLSETLKGKKRPFTHREAMKKGWRRRHERLAQVHRISNE